MKVRWFSLICAVLLAAPIGYFEIGAVWLGPTFASIIPLALSLTFYVLALAARTYPRSALLILVLVACSAALAYGQFSAALTCPGHFGPESRCGDVVWRSQDYFIAGIIISVLAAVLHLGSGALLRRAVAGTPKKWLFLIGAIGLGLIVLLSIGPNRLVNGLFVAVCSVTGGPCDP